MGHWSGKPKAIRAVVQSERDSWAERRGGRRARWEAVPTCLSGSHQKWAAARPLASPPRTLWWPILCMKMEESTHVGDKQFLVWMGYFNPLIWISLVQNFLFRVADLWLPFCPLSSLWAQISGMLPRASCEWKMSAIGAFSVQWSITQEASSKGSYGRKKALRHLICSHFIFIYFLICSLSQ